MTVGEANDGKTYRTMIGEWAAAARGNGEFIGIGATVAGVGTFFLALALHGYSYNRGGVPAAIAYPSAVVAQLVVIALITAALSLYPSARATRWWRLLGAAAGAAMLIFAVLPAVVAGYPWLAVLLLTMLTIVYDVVVSAYVSVVRPWAYLAAR
jgi:hypothetical protein